jgi:hypothetical protein
MGGIEMRVDSGDGSQRVCRVHHEGLLQLFENGTVEWPQIKESDIDDRIQGDKLVKAIALLQIIWFFAQTVGRAIEGLAVTTLELFTIGNVICATITFLAWWNKPNGVRAPILIEGVAPSWVHCPNRIELIDGNSAERRTGLAGLFIGFSFGALHLSAWNSYFASMTERILWRISSIGVTVFSATLPLWDLLIVYSDTIAFAQFFSMPIYCLFRFYMFVEMFVALRDVPVDVYRTVQWSQYFPSLG